MSHTRYGHMVHEYYVDRVKKALDERSHRLQALATRADAEAYVRDARKRVATVFPALPRRSPLNPTVTRRFNRDGYDVECVRFESRPGLQVSANLYLPDARAEPVPGVLGLCGHSMDGKAEGKYQRAWQGLVRKGFAVLCIDPISQGERHQFWAGDRGGKRNRELPNLCAGHNILGNQMVLNDDFFGTWRVWDAIRGLDYLCSRPEVDPARIGVTGNSGGGTLTAFVAALDPRPAAVAPSCYICSYLANILNEIPSDAEQNPPGALARGLDQADLLLCYAPRPTLVLSQHDDFFDVRFARAASAEVGRVHRLLGARGTSAFYAGPHGHGFHQENREAMYGFFMKHLGVRRSKEEPRTAPEEARELWCTPGGDARNSESIRVFDLLSSPVRPRLSGDELRKSARRLLAIPGKRPQTQIRKLVHYQATGKQGGRTGQFAVVTEPGIQSILTVHGQTDGIMHLPSRSLILYVGHAQSAEDLEGVPAVRALCRGKRNVVAVDPRGFGYTASETCGTSDFFAPYGSDYLYAATAEMLGESFLGRRVQDVLSVIDCLEDAASIEIVGRGVGSVIAAFAALLHPAVGDITLLHYLPSYSMLLEDPLANWPLSSLLRGVLRHFDLPDVYQSLRKRLHLRNPWGAVI